MRAALAFLSLAASALAIAVNEPGTSEGWSLGANNNTVSWTSVSTDPANFTILLVNQNTTPAFQQVIKALQPTSEGSTTIALPNTVTAGSGYRVNLVQDSQNLNAILAQSGNFTIAAAQTSPSSAASSNAASSTKPASATTPAGTSSASGTSASASSSPSGTTTSGASRTIVDGVAMMVLAAVGSMLV